MHPPFLHLGFFQITLFGICAAVGVMAALTLCQVTARLVRLDAAKVWDATLALAVAALVVSRILLVIGSWHSFLQAPLLILSLPSLNDTGMLLTAIFGFFYLRWKHLPLLSFLDALAPCIPLVWAFVNLGYILEGTKNGMPTRFFLAVGGGLTGGVHPVEVYAMVTGMVLCGILIRVLPKLRHPGFGCALGLVLGGASIFLLDFLRLPDALFVQAMLDPVQWLGLSMIILGAALYLFFPELPQRQKESADAL